MQGRYAALTALMVGVGLGAGIALERYYISPPDRSGATGPDVLYWVAPMDPNFRRDEPGKSPMGMDLVPVYEGEEPSGDPSVVKLSPVEINAIGVRTAVSRVEPLSRRIETVGFVGYDEHATSHIHMRVEGWIEKLKVRAVGDRVSKGDVLFELYAPEITVASAELVQGMRRSDQQYIDAAKRKLRNFGVTERQIEEMAAAQAPAEHVRVYAPQDGVVIALDGADGMYLKPETRAMSLTDLSAVWLIIDVFEQDIGGLTSDMTAEAEFEHLPGKVFAGAVEYIYPELDPTTRTLPVRLRFDNSEGLLRPNMFATVSLVPQKSRDALTVPSEAVIRTGRADRVILKTGDGVFRPRLVTTGLRDSFGAGDRTEIVQGLGPGEEVVASAQFLIDSESALNAGLLRMAPTEAEPAMGKGSLVSLDVRQRIAVIRHEPIEALDWPAMETRFALRADVSLDRLQDGEAVEFSAVRGADGLIALTALRRDDGVDAVGMGVVHAVTADGKLSVSHDPIPTLGWPAMTMDLPVAGFDPASAPLETPVELALSKGADGLFTIVGVTAEGEPATEQDNAQAVEAAEEQQVMETKSDDPPQIRVTGTVNSIDLETGVANVTHGPIAEIGMPGMTMDFRLHSEVAPEELPIGAEAPLLLVQNPDFSMTLLGVDEETAQ
ncbi:MAG: efflux RND transporter periplasmic adaptor subunit [Pseudomonadota bacterium]